MPIPCQLFYWWCFSEMLPYKPSTKAFRHQPLKTTFLIENFLFPYFILKIANNYCFTWITLLSLFGWWHQLMLMQFTTYMSSYLCLVSLLKVESSAVLGGGELEIFFGNVKYLFMSINETSMLWNKTAYFYYSLLIFSWCHWRGFKAMWYSRFNERKR